MADDFFDEIEDAQEYWDEAMDNAGEEEHLEFMRSREEEREEEKPPTIPQEILSYYERGDNEGLRVYIQQLIQVYGQNELLEDAIKGGMMLGALHEKGALVMQPWNQLNG